jgi:hypothetical protein
MEYTRVNENISDLFQELSIYKKYLIKFPKCSELINRLPSWLSKAANQSKATAMGVNASSQFLGAFFGGVTGGQLLLLNNTALGWSILTGLAIVWLLISFGLAQPYLSSMVLRLPEHKQTDEWTSQLLAIRMNLW